LAIVVVCRAGVDGARAEVDIDRASGEDARARKEIGKARRCAAVLSLNSRFDRSTLVEDWKIDVDCVAALKKAC
jgi:hypothetical protein